MVVLCEAFGCDGGFESEGRLDGFRVMDVDDRWSFWMFACDRGLLGELVGWYKVDLDSASCLVCMVNLPRGREKVLFVVDW